MTAVDDHQPIQTLRARGADEAARPRVAFEATRRDHSLRTRFKLELFLQLSRLFVVTAGALALVGNPFLGLRGARVQLLGTGGLLLGGGGRLGGLPTQNIRFRTQLLSPAGMRVCLLTMSGGF